MSNDLVLAQIKTDLGALELGVDDETKAVAGSGGVKRISIKGGVFRKYAGGKEVAAVADRFMHIIFAKMSPTAARMFYPGAYVEGKKISPACWSSDARTPDPDVKDKPSATCKECPNSVKGSASNGRSSACRLSWRTAVVLPGDPSGDLLQLVIPAASVWGDEFNGARPFQPYVKHLAANDVSAGHIITKMEFDLRQPSPTLLFSAVMAVPSSHLSLIKSQGASGMADAMIKMNVYQADSATDEEVEAPQPQGLSVQAGVTVGQVEVGVTNGASPVVQEPVLREVRKSAVEVQNQLPLEEPKPEVSEILKKWSGKK